MEPNGKQAQLDAHGRDIARVERKVDTLDEKFDEQIGGDGGLREQLTELRTEMRVRLAVIGGGVLAISSLIQIFGAGVARAFGLT